MKPPPFPFIISPVDFQKITLVGVGMLGGSIGLATKRCGVAARVCGLVRREVSIAECLAAGVVDDATLDIAEAAFADDMIGLFANDKFCRQQRTQPTAFLRIWIWPEAAAAFKYWISS